MNEHTITGPYEDKQGQYWLYRGWRLVRWEDCNEAMSNAGFRDCRKHPVGQPIWGATPTFEGGLSDYIKIGTAAGFARGTEGRRPGVARHVDGDNDYPTSTIEATIDAWETARERLFREALAEAMRER